MPEKRDLIVIGGGPAGTSLSILMARAGFDVLLLEKGRYPFQKVCGEYLSREALPYLEELGVPYQDLAPPPIDRLRLSSSKGAGLEVELPLGGIGLSRYEMDRMLADRAKAEGVEVREGCKVRSIEGTTVSTREDSYEAKSVVSATGKDKGPKIHTGTEEAVPSQRKGSEGKAWVGIKYSVEGPLPDKEIELHTFPGGYAGLSRVEGSERGCMSYLIEASRLKGTDRGNAEKELLRTNPALAERLKALRFPEHASGISDLSFGRKELHEEKVWYAGDAAGSIPPFAGNGMSMALEGSFLLAPPLAAFLDGKFSEEDTLRWYRKERERLFGTRMGIGGALQRFFVRDGRMNALIRCMKPFPGLTKRLIRLTHGTQSSSGVS
jgi:flavin-dependent dehydrogenase